MTNQAMFNGVVVLGVCALLAGCSGPKPVVYRGIASANVLQANPEDRTGRIPYAYSSPVNWRNYSKIIISPVVVYQGPDNQFGRLSQADRAALADYMQRKFTEKLGEHFVVAGAPDANTLRLQLTLTGAQTSTPVLSTLMHIDLAGNLYNGVQAVRGGQGAMTGSVMYSVEIYDSQSNQLLDAYVTKQYPNSENVAASFGALGAAKTGIEKGANALARQLD